MNELKSIFAISLITIFLAGIVGVNYDTHFCCGEMIDSEISIAPKDLSCGMPIDAAPSNKDKGESISALCCENHRLTFEIDNDYSKHSQHDQFLPQMDVVPTDVEMVLAQTCNQPKYEDLGYSPPPLDRDIIVLVQSYLI